MMSGALLMVSFGTACGLAEVGAAAEGDGGADTNGSVDGTSGASGAANGGNTSGGGVSTQGGNANDGAGITYTGDAGVTSDGGLPASKTPVVQLGMARTFAILSKGGISTVPTAVITGNLGISPAAATYITGFSLTADPTNVFSTAPQVIGKVFAADYAVPSPSKLTTAIGDMETAFTAAAARAPNVTELGAGNIGGKNLAPGVYNWSTGLLIPTNVTLTGSAKDVWVFQVAQTLTMASNTRVVLAGGALAKNVFWQVAGAVDLGTTSHCEGVILTKTAINLRTGASINGRLFAQTAVTIAKSTVTAPAN